MANSDLTACDDVIMTSLVFHYGVFEEAFFCDIEYCVELFVT